MDNHDHHSYKILSEIHSGKPLSQRSLSRELGIALGLTNLLIKRLVKKGYVKTSGAIHGGRVQYLLTPRGIAEKTRLSIAYLENTIHLYTETREKIRSSLDALALSDGDGNNIRQKIIFYGAGDVAEIAYITLNDSAFELIGVVDDHKDGQKFFGRLVASPEDLSLEETLRTFDRVVVMTFRKSKDIQKRLLNLKIPKEKVSFL
ncbi:MAG TPA: winged helix-turn-helix transcriptional regulator [Acidobacteriota bacterium]